MEERGVSASTIYLAVGTVLSILLGAVNLMRSKTESPKDERELVTREEHDADIASVERRMDSNRDHLAGKFEALVKEIHEWRRDLARREGIEEERQRHERNRRTGDTQGGCAV